MDPPIEEWDFPISISPQEIEMKPNKLIQIAKLEDSFPFQLSGSLVSMLIFSGVYRGSLSQIVCSENKATLFFCSCYIRGRSCYSAIWVYFS